MHRLSHVDAEQRTAICEECGPVKVKPKGYSSAGTRLWRCNKGFLESHYRLRHNHPRRVYRKHLGDACERTECQAVIEDACQLDVHHIDGDHTNNDPSNLMTLCANCHRLMHNRDCS